MAIALVTLTWCDRHLTDKDEEVPATQMPPWADGLSVDLCAECAEPVLAAYALAEKYGSRGDRTPKPPKRVKTAARKHAATATAADRDSEANGTTRQGLPALYTCPACGSAHSSRQSLASHARAQHGKTLPELEGKDTPHKCTAPGCDRSFTTPQGLALHERSHTSQRSAAS